MFIVRLAVFVLGLYPDLQEMHRFAIGRIEFTVGDSAAGAHVLNFTGTDNAAVAHAVFVFELPLQNDREDFHILVRVGAETLAGLHNVFVDNAQRSKTHVRPVLVVPEREGMKGAQPSVVKVSTLAGFADLNHRGSSPES